MTTQQPDDVTQHPLARTAVQQTQTGIYLPNPNGYWESYKEFGLTIDEFEIIKSLPTNSRSFLVKQNGKSAVCTFDLSGLGEVLLLLSANIENVRKLDLIRERVGDDPKDWLPVLIREAL